MTTIFELLKSLLCGVIEGITEWLPISSTGHLILTKALFDQFGAGNGTEFFKNVSTGFWDMFEVVIQLGAIIAVVVLFWNQIWPFSASKKEHYLKKDKWILWAKILVACVPAAIVGVFLDDTINAVFYNATTVGIMLLVIGISFLVVETVFRGKAAKTETLEEITFVQALLIGVFQLIAAVFPGTSRSGATILGGLSLGLSRKVAAEFTFFLAIPVMFGASLLKLVKFGLSFTVLEAAILVVGMLVSFVVSMVCIRFLMDFIKRHDFKVFGWYRIVLGALVLIYFTFNTFPAAS